jgi:hypothetical protein
MTRRERSAISRNRYDLIRPATHRSINRKDYSMSSDVRSLDAEYRFGRPKVYLTPIETARLVIARSKLGGTWAERAAEKITAVVSLREHDRGPSGRVDHAA